MLATINTEAPVEFDVEELKVKQPNLPELLKIFEELEFRTMAKRIVSDYKDKIDKEIATEKKEFTVYKIGLDTSGGATYTVNGETVSDYFYGIDGVTYDIKASGKTANATLNKTSSSSEFSSGESIQYKVAGARTLKAVYGSGSNSESGGSSGNMDDYDDVPKTGESKADIWILWTVLFIAILGAGFMIWKRFGLVRAIAAADAEVAIAEEEERIETEKKEKEDKLNMLKDLRNL